MTATHSEPLLPAQPFFSTPQQRLALARQRYFEEGVRPSGLVSEGVIQSWARCLQARRAPHEAVAFNSVTASRVHSALARSRMLASAGVQVDFLHAPKVGAHSPRWRLHLGASHSPAEIDDLAELVCDIFRIFAREDRASSARPPVQV